MGMKINDRNARRMMERMGINQKEVPDVEEVIIRTRTKDLVIAGASVSEVNFQGNRVFQVAGEVEEVARESRSSPTTTSSWSSSRPTSRGKRRSRRWSSPTARWRRPSCS